MSGGSHRYLCLQAGACGTINLADLRGMRDRLAELAPASAAAIDTARLCAVLDALVPGDGALVEVWRAVEWLDSGDGDAAAVAAAVGCYAGRPGLLDTVGAAPEISDVRVPSPG